MKRITLLLSVLLLSFAVAGQVVSYYPEDLEKLKKERYAEAEARQDFSHEAKHELKSESEYFLKDASCPEGTILSNMPDGGTGYTSSEDADIINYQSISDLPGGVVGGISIWAIQGYFDGAGWSECGPMDMEFDIIFYEDDNGEPGDVIATETHTISPVADTDVEFGDWTVSTFKTYLSDPVAITDGWFSIASKNSPTCWSLIINSDSGEGAAGYYDEGTWMPRETPVAFCILAPLADPEAPAAPYDFVVEVGEMGALNADISWVNPDETFDGDVLVDLDEVVLYRDGEVIYFVSDPVIGGDESYFDDDITEPGMYNYVVRGYNDAGEGLSASATVYIGEDIRGVPENVELEAVGNDGSLSWDAPVEGLHGGYIDADNIVYNIVRMPDEVEVAESIVETQFLDTEIPGIGNYYYIVTASNDIGEGGSAASNPELLGAEGVLMYETFDYEAGTLPPGWVVDGLGADNWAVSNSSSAGGTAPELRLNWSPSFNGFSRLITVPVDVEGYSEVRFRYNMYLNNYSFTNEGEIAGIDISFDEGDNWDSIWEVVIEDDVPAGVYENYINIPDGETTMHLSFRFEGNSFNINQWYFDNLLIEPVVEHDLYGVSISGNTTPSVSYETTYTITIQNAGTETQTDYTVKLMKEGGIELASVPGETIEFGETKSFDISWTPQEGDEGETYIYGYVDLPADEVPGNNQTPHLNLNVQPEDVLAVTIGDGEKLTTIPYNFVWHYSVSQTLFYPDEIGMGGGVITGLQYTNSFNEDYLDKHIMIWIGETDAEDLSEGWVDPESLQLVFDGYVDFPEGVNDIFITLDDIYVYTGGNLVIYSYKADDVWSGGKNFFNTEDPESNRTRRAQRDNTPFDPLEIDADGTVVSDFPNISMFFSTAGLGALDGNVTDGTDPLEGVLVDIHDSNISTYTDESGDYEFPYLLPGSYDLTYSKFGYFDYTETGVVVEEDVTITVNVSLDVIPQYSVSGAVKTNDEEDIFIEGAIVTLQGYDNFETTTDANGSFGITGVYEGVYDINISYPGYESYESEIIVDSNTDLGEIELIEIIVEPYGLNVDVDHELQSADFSWNEGALMKLFQHDGAIPDDPNAFYQTDDQVYGTIFDLSAYPDAVVSYIDFHHLQWGVAPGNYDYLVHIVDWQNFTIIETVGPLSTEATDDWEETVAMGEVNVAGYEQVGILIQPQGHDPADAYPCITADATGPNGLSISAPANDLSSYAINSSSVGDFFINLWITTAYDESKTVKAGRFVSNNIESLETRKGASTSISETSISQDAQCREFGSKAFVGFNVYLNDKVNPLNPEPIEENSYLFEGLETGIHNAGVQSVYTTGESRIVDITFDVKETFEVSFNVVGDNGAISAYVDDEEITSGDNVIIGTDVTFVAQPDTDYLIKQWTLNGEVIMDGGEVFNGSTYTYNEISQEINVTVEFKPVSYMVMFNVIGGNGTISAEVDGVNIAPGAYIEKGKDVIFTAQPYEQYLIREWLVNANVVIIDDAIFTGDVFTYEDLDRNLSVSVIFEHETSVAGFDINDITAYPNPFNDKLHIKNVGDVNRIVITNVLGTVVKDMEVTGDKVINTSDFTPGIYFITFETSTGEKVIRKLMKQ